MRENETFPSLTGLRFVLALWICVYHLVKLYGPPELASAWYIQLGNARVDAFFTLSGFVLAHVYAMRDPGAFDFKSFLVARVARLWPLHLLGLAILLVAVGAAFAMGRAAEVGAYTPLGLAANVLFLQAWGIPGAAQWNFPTWTLSAEAFAYLLFPLFLIAAIKLRARPLVLLGAAAALTALVGFVFPVLGVGPLNQASQVLGVVRGALGFFLGFLARFAFERLPAHPAYGGALALVGGLAAGWAALSGAPLVMVSLGACGLVAGFAALDRAGLRNPLTLAPMQHLGRWSYAMFVLHVPLFIIMTREMDKLGWDGQLSLGLGAAMMLLVIALSAPAHLLVEEPARRAIRAFGTGKRPFRTLIARRLRTSQA